MLPCHMLSSYFAPSPFPSLAPSDRPLPSVYSVPSVLKSPFHNPTFPPSNDKPLPYSLFSLSRKNHAKLNPPFSISSALFKKDCSRNSFPINNFRTLLQNTGGGRYKYLYPLLLHRYLAFQLQSLQSFTHNSRHTPGVGPRGKRICRGTTEPIQPFSSPRYSLPTIHYSLPIQKQAPSPTVKQPSGLVCPGGL